MMINRTEIDGRKAGKMRVGLKKNGRTKRLINDQVEATVTFMGCRAKVTSEIVNRPISGNDKSLAEGRRNYGQMIDIAINYPMVPRFRDGVAEYKEYY